MVAKDGTGARAQRSKSQAPSFEPCVLVAWGSVAQVRDRWLQKLSLKAPLTTRSTGSATASKSPGRLG